ncbi:hypothetical protein [Brevundimonas sp.]|uniref:hypothetical protein n=1 Tax=Brevundimonas sp. TaxID=1871086 RepID=UPI0035616393
MTASLANPRAPLARKAVFFVILAGLGGAFGYGVSTLVDGYVIAWEDELAVLMATILMATGVISAFIVATRPTTVPRGCGVLQAVVMTLAGLLFLLPVFGPEWVSATVVFGIVLVLLAVQTVANLMLWRAADEMLRRIMAETSAIAFWALQMALFVYAAAERLGLVETITGWGLMGILMGVYFISSIVASARRGIIA